jgi:hypothetical protein
MINMEMRICQYCDLMKSISEFHTKYMCSLCRITRKGDASRNRSKNKKKEVSEYNKNYYQNNKQEILEYKEIYKEKNSDKLLAYAREHQKIYREQNPEKVSESNKKYNENHKEQKKKYDREYWILNKPKRLAQAIANHLRRLKEDPVYKLRSIVSVSIGGALKRANSSKNGSSILKFLPYSFQQLKDHLEEQFESWMTWSNYGTYRLDIWDDNNSTTWTWQLDHIIPHSKFPYVSMSDQEFKDCWALSNLRPYSAKQNVIDKDRK